MTNREAFLQMIGLAELGPDLIELSDRGYNVIVGSTVKKPILFPMPDGEPDYFDHPRIHIEIPRLGITSSAAGLFQIEEDIFDSYKNRLSLPDFSPASQHKIAMQLIRECRALDSIDAGYLNEAILKCSSRWASLPGASYGQHEHTFGTLRGYYLEAGGMIAGLDKEKKNGPAV